MSLKSEIKKAINNNSKKFRAIKVHKINQSEYMDESVTLWIEVSAVKRKKKKKK